MVAEVLSADAFSHHVQHLGLQRLMHAPEHVIRDVIDTFPEIHIVHACAPFGTQMTFQYLDPLGRQECRSMNTVGDISHRVFVVLDLRPHPAADIRRHIAVNTRHAIVETRAANRQSGHVELRAILGAPKRKEFFATQFEFRVVLLKVRVHHTFAEVVVPCRYGGVRSEDGVGRNTFQCGCEIQTIVADLLADTLQHQEGRVAFIDMPYRRLQSQFLQRAHPADTEHDLLLHAHHFIATIQAVGNVAVVRIVALDIGIQQIQRDMTDPGLPYLEVEGAIIGQLYRSVGFRTVGTSSRCDRQIVKIRIGVAGDLVTVAIDGLVEITLSIQQTDSDEWQAQVARSLAVVARQNAQTA